MNTYNTICNYLQQSMTTSEIVHGWRHYSILSGSKVIPFYQNCRTLLQHGTTGLCAWPAAWRLAEFAYTNNSIFSNKSLLELGSGLGAGGVFVSYLSKPREIILTDVHSEVLRKLTLNSKVLQNMKPEMTVGVRELDWCSFDPTELMKSISEADIVIGADLLYDPAVFSDLVKENVCYYHICAYGTIFAI